LTFTALPGLTNQGIINPANSILNAGLDAPRSMPLSSALNNLITKLDGTQMSINLEDIIQPMSRFHNDVELKNGWFSLTPDYPDQSAQYSDLTASIRNPLSGYADSVDGNVGGRSSFPFTIVQNTPTSAIVDMVICEPIFLSPWAWGKGIGTTGFIGVQNLEITLNFTTNAGSRMWSHVQNGYFVTGGYIQGNNPPNFPNTTYLNTWPVIQNIVASYGGFGVGGAGNPAFSYSQSLPTLLLEYLTPTELQEIPRSVAYPYFLVDSFTTQGNLIPPNSIGANGQPVINQIKVTTQNIVLTSIPNRIYLYVRNSNNTLENGISSMNYVNAGLTYNNTGWNGSQFTDSYAVIDNVSINFNNRAGLLSTCTPQDLYKMAVRNGLNMSWEQWSGGPLYLPSGGGTTFPTGLAGALVGGYENGSVGSICCFQMGIDLPCKPAEAPGVGGNWNLQTTVNFHNNNFQGSAIPNLGITNFGQMNWVIYIVVVYEGAMTIAGGQCLPQISVLSHQDVLNAVSRQKYLTLLDVEEIYGGGNWLSGIKRFGHDLLGKITRGLELAHEYAPKAVPYIKRGLEIANQISPYFASGDGVRVAGDIMGGVPVGGRRHHMAKHSKRSLLSRLR
jgi:hypothetical protein